MNRTPVSRTVDRRTPPCTNRGAVLTPGISRSVDTQVGIHWLSATIPLEAEISLEDALGFISVELCGADWSSYDRGANGYTKTFKTAFGLRLLANDQRPEMGFHMIADGECCGALGAQHLRNIILGLKMRATRLDLAADNCRFTADQVRDEWCRDNVRTACKPSRKALPGREKLRSCSWYSSPSGDTFNMGSRTSTAFARCYNERGFTRFELELKAERADRVSHIVFSNVEGPAQSAVAAMRDFVDFVDARSSANRSRCPLLPFWRDFVAGTSRAHVRLLPRPEPAIERTVDWIEGQVATSLVVYETYIQSAFGTSREQVRHRLRRLGQDRIKPRHEAVRRFVPDMNDGHLGKNKLASS